MWGFPHYNGFLFTPGKLIELPSGPSLTGFVTKLLLELLQSLVQFVLETQFKDRNSELQLPEWQGSLCRGTAASQSCAPAEFYLDFKSISSQCYLPHLVGLLFVIHNQAWRWLWGTEIRVENIEHNKHKEGQGWLWLNSITDSKHLCKSLTTNMYHSLRTWVFEERMVSLMPTPS